MRGFWGRVGMNSTGTGTFSLSHFLKFNMNWVTTVVGGMVAMTMYARIGFLNGFWTGDRRVLPTAF